MKSKKEKPKMDGIEFAKKIQSGEIPFEIFCDELTHPNPIGSYGSDKELDRLVDSKNVSDRLKAVEIGYGLDKLMEDESPEVRDAVMDYMGWGEKAYRRRRVETMERIKRQQKKWSASRNLEMDEKYDMYVKNVNDNILGGLDDRTKLEFEKADGGELSGKNGQPAKMAALHSSSALCVNVFQYFREKPELQSELLKACGIDYCEGKPVAFEFECTDYPIKIDGKVIARPNIDLLIKTDKGEIVAFESKFTESYKEMIYGFLSKKYYENGKSPLWDRMGELYDELGIENENVEVKDKEGKVKGKNLSNVKYYRHLDTLQLIKHVLGLSCDPDVQMENVTLVYVWYDNLGKIGKNIKEEIERFRQFVECNTDIVFKGISYYNLISNLCERLDNDEHKAYLDYITERYD